MLRESNVPNARPKLPDVSPAPPPNIPETPVISDEYYVK